MTGLTQAETKLLRLLERRSVRESPEVSALARELDVHHSTVQQHLQALAAKGFIVYDRRGVGRRPVIALRAERGVPLVGSISAGPLADALEQPEGYIGLPYGPGHFALRVKGDSMAEPIQNGDVVILRRTPEFRSGDVCAVRVGGDEVTLKYVERYSSDARLLLLRPHNPAYDPVEVAADDTFIAGVFRALLRGDVTTMLLTEGDVS